MNYLTELQLKLQGYKTYVVAALWGIAELAYLAGGIDMTMRDAIRAIALPALAVTLNAKLNRNS